MNSNSQRCRLAKRIRAHVVLGMIWLLAPLLTGSAQIPTAEERARDSGMNPDYNPWKAERIHGGAYPKQAEKAPAPTLCFRYDFTLPAKPRQALVTFFPTRGWAHRIFMNGRMVADALPKGKDFDECMGRKDVDLAPYLQSGANILTVKGPMEKPIGEFTFLGQGIVFGEDGSIVRLQTDKTWRGGWNLTAGWDLPATNPTNLPLVVSQGPVDWREEPMRVIPSYYGPIQIGPKGVKEPLFDEEKLMEFAIRLINQQAPNKPMPSLVYELMDENTRRPVGQGAVTLKPEGTLDYTGDLKIGPLPAGVYRCRLLLKAGGQEVARRDYEVVSIGVIKQRLIEGTHFEDGLALKEIWSMDCTAEPKPDEFLTIRDWNGKGELPVETRVVDGPAGRYREMVKPGLYSQFAYRFKVKRLFVPHLAVVEWPDDANRYFQAQIMEGATIFPRGSSGNGYLGLTRGEAAVMCVDDHPRSNKMKKLHILYWPNEEEEGIHIWNLDGPAPAAASRITVYEITNDIPALRIADAGDRLIGYHTERGDYTMAHTYYAGPMGAYFPWLLIGPWAGFDHAEFYRNWHTTTENMIKRMRFSGQNMYFMGHFMYWDALYPSHRYGDAGKKDYGALILKMYERNGLNMISGVECWAPQDFAIKPTREMNDAVRAGEPTPFTVMRDGTLQTVGGYASPNFLHPQVQEGLLTIVDELIELYKDYPAWKGIAFIINSTFSGPLARFTKEPFDSGYEDYTVTQFEKDTGRKIPAGAKDQERFMKRYEWIMANAKQDWVDWRCRKFTELYGAMRDRIVKARPDLKMYLCMREPQAARIAQFADQLQDPAGMRQVLKSMGFDADALKKEPGMVISFMYMSPGTRHGKEADQAEIPRIWRDFAHNQDWNDLFANDGKGGAYIFSGFTENNKKIAASKKWMWTRTGTRQGYPWPPDEYANDTFVNVFVRSNPTWMPHTWIDVNDPSGHLHEQRLFARAYRSLPNGKYERLKGNGLDKNIWVESLRARGAEYAYAANPQWWPLDKVTLTFTEGVKVHDLIRDQPVPLKNNQWTFKLGPYDIQTFRVETAALGQPSAVRGANVTVSPAAAGVLDRRLDQIDALAAVAHAKTGELADSSWNGIITILDHATANITALRKVDDLTGAGEQAAAWQVKRAMAKVTTGILNAMPFAVIGPFGKRQWTDPQKPTPGNPEVVATFDGMETPYLGEFAGTNWTTLQTGFVPDFKKKYAAGTDTLIGWQTAVKTNVLSFSSQCRLEFPYWMITYGYTEVYSPESREVRMLTGSDHALWVWVNDRLVLRHGGHGAYRGGQRPARDGQDQEPVRLEKGWNRVLLKAAQRGECRVFLRFADQDGNGLYDLKYRVPPMG